MHPEEAKERLKQILGTEITFNKDFDNYFAKLKQSMQENLLSWCAECAGGTAKGSVPTSKEHKDKFVFFRKIGDNTRGILVKEQNGGFIELYLTSHKEYDDIRVNLGYKKSSYYSS